MSVNSNEKILFASVKNAVCEWVKDSREAQTPQTLIQRIQKTFSLPRSQAKTLLSSLIRDGEFAYRDLHGRVIVEPSFSKPVRISRRVVIKPSGALFEASDEILVVTLDHHASFGVGQHPTTQLCIQFLEHILLTEPVIPDIPNARVLDIGTGSGILCLVSLAMGVGSGVGIDIDPWALWESRENARLNGLSHRFTVSDDPVESLWETFDLILANLRWPVIHGILPYLSRLCAPHGVLIISGLRPAEFPRLVILSASHFRCIRQATLKDWTGGIFTHGQHP